MFTFKNQLKALIKHLPPLRLPFGIYTIRKVTSLRVAALGEFDEVFPAELIKRTAPVTLDNLHYKFLPGAPGITDRSIPTYCALLQDASVIGVSGAVVDSRKKLIGDVSVELGKAIEDHSLLQTIQFRKPLTLRGLSILIAAPDAASNYFHWMTDALPRIIIAANYRFFNKESVHVIVSGSSKPFQLASLKLAGLTTNNIISLEEHPIVACEGLVATSPTCLSGNVPYWIVEFLRDTFSGWLKSAANSPEKIFISRKEAFVRRLLNEKGVGDYLSREGFEIVSLEGTTPGEQAKLFYNAEEIIGVHGAGLTNLVFTKPGTRVIEIFSPTYVNQCYWTIACQVKLNYAYLLGEEVGQECETNGLIDPDITVSIEKLHSLRQKFKAVV